MTVKLYVWDVSPPVRAAMMACEIFNVPVELIEVKLKENDHLKPEYLKMNPLHTIPVLQDGDLTLHDSHAILMYLADTYGKDDSWYPKDTVQRALVNQKLFFDTSYLFPRLRVITYALIMDGVKTIPQKLLDNIDEAYGFMEQFLSNTRYIAGDRITIADVSAISDITSLIELLPLDEQKYPKTFKWLKEMEKKPYCEKLNKPGSAKLGELVRELLQS